jgi:hypothetical protein
MPKLSVSIIHCFQYAFILISGWAWKGSWPKEAEVGLFEFNECWLSRDYKKYQLSRDYNLSASSGHLWPVALLPRQHAAYHNGTTFFSVDVIDYQFDPQPCYSSNDVSLPDPSDQTLNDSLLLLLRGLEQESAM